MRSAKVLITGKFSILVIGMMFPWLIAYYSAEDPDHLVYNDHVYNPNIKSVKLYPDNGEPESILNPPVSPISQIYPFQLEFDELYEDARYYQVKIVLCDWDWTPSGLTSIEYLDTYNETDINSYQYSVNTKIPYTHYKVTLPRVKMPGNYVAYVYDRDDPERIILSRRYIVHEELIKIISGLVISDGVAEKRTHQEIEFTINYQRLESLFPEKDIKVVIRQNDSWVNIISGLKPTMIHDRQKVLEYHHFNLENNFPGGNEYRFIDMRSSVSAGRNVNRINTGADRIDAFIGIDKPRPGESYGTWEDLDGAYYISTLDGNDPAYEADYMLTHFFLQTGSKLNSDIYLYGELSFRQTLPEYKMKYDPGLGGYTIDIMLKEGYYEYHYLTSTSNRYEVEGNHAETENTYDIIVYYLPFSKITHQAAGYARFRTRNDN